MNNMVNLIIAPGMLGFIGVQDCLNTQYRVEAKQSIWATPEQNKKFEENLRGVYEEYLQGVADSNNGRY